MALDWPIACPVETPLRRLVDAHAQGQPVQPLLRDPAIAPFARRLPQPLLVEDSVLVELLAVDGDTTRLWSADRLARMQIAPLARGWDAWLVRMPLGAVAQLPRELAGLQTARLPWARRPLVGAKLSQGVAVTGADMLHCTGHHGLGTTVAIVDDLWHGLSNAIAQDELPHVIGKGPYQSPDKSDVHGTACAEIVADMAPQTNIVISPVTTLPEMQVALAKLLAAGVQVASDSSGWTTGYSFGDGTGKPCEFVTKARSQGLLWVASAGNEADHSLWLGTWQDSDGDGWLEFDGNSYASLWGQKGDLSTVELDWDDYPHSGIDLDLVVCAGGAWPCQQLATSNATQDGGQTPQEVVQYEFTKTGTVRMGVRLKKGSKVTKKGLGVRLAVEGQSSLQPWVSAGTLVDPAQCVDAVAVGAIDVDMYAEGPPSPYSSRGPTWDGRNKPDITAPTQVATSVMAAFNGTSAACPHMVGALALQMARANQNAEQALQFLYAAAVPMGDTTPNNEYGRGRLALPSLPESCASPRADADVAADVPADAGPSDPEATGGPDLVTLNDAGIAGADVVASPPATVAPAGCSARRPSGDKAVALAWAALAAGAWQALRRRRARAHT